MSENVKTIAQLTWSDLETMVNEERENDISTLRLLRVVLRSPGKAHKDLCLLRELGEPTDSALNKWIQRANTEVFVPFFSEHQGEYDFSLDLAPWRHKGKRGLCLVARRGQGCPTAVTWKMLKENERRRHENVERAPYARIPAEFTSSTTASRPPAAWFEADKSASFNEQPAEPTPQPLSRPPHPLLEFLLDTASIRCLNLVMNDPESFSEPQRRHSQARRLVFHTAAQALDALMLLPTSKLEQDALDKPPDWLATLAAARGGIGAVVTEHQDWDADESIWRRWPLAWFKRPEELFTALLPEIALIRDCQTDVIPEIGTLITAPDWFVEEVRPHLVLKEPHTVVGLGADWKPAMDAILFHVHRMGPKLSTCLKGEPEGSAYWPQLIRSSIFLRLAQVQAPEEESGKWLRAVHPDAGLYQERMLEIRLRLPQPGSAILNGAYDTAEIVEIVTEVRDLLAAGEGYGWIYEIERQLKKGRVDAVTLQGSLGPTAEALWKSQMWQGQVRTLIVAGFDDGSSMGRPHTWMVDPQAWK